MLAVLSNIVRLGGMQVVIALTAIVRNKVISVRLGPEGYGEFIQLVMVVTAASVVAAFGLGMSLNRNVAAAGDAAGRQRLLGQANAINLMISFVLAGALAIFLAYEPASLGWIGLEPRVDTVLSISVLLMLIPLDAAVQHRIGFLIGAQDIHGMTSGRSAALIAGTIISVPLIWYFGLAGAAIQLVALSALIVLMLDRRIRFLGFRAWAVAFHRATFLLLARLGVAAIVAGFAAQLSDLLVRSSLLKAKGAAESGIYQSALSISYQVRAVVLGSVGSYMIAILSENTERQKVIDTANKLLAIVLPIALAAFAGLGLFSRPLILLLYSPEFLPAQQLFPIMLVGFYAEVMVWVIGAPLLALDRVGIWLAFELLFSALCLLIALPLLAPLGMLGVAIAYAASAGIHLIVNWTYFSRALRFHVRPRQGLVFLLGSVTIGVFGLVGATGELGIGDVVLGVTALVGVTLGCLQLLIGLGSIWTAGKAWLAERGAKDA